MTASVQITFEKQILNYKLFLKKCIIISLHNYFRNCDRIINYLNRLSHIALRSGGKNKNTYQQIDTRTNIGKEKARIRAD